MKFYRYQISAIFLLMTITSHGMERASHTIEEIPIPVDWALKYVKYISKHEIFVEGSGPCYECCILNLKTKNKVSIDNSRSNNARRFAVFYDNTIITELGDKVMIYDTQTSEKVYLHDRILQLAHHPYKDTFFLTPLSREYPKLPEDGEIIKYNYKTKTYESTVIPGISYPRIDIHPKEATVCINESEKGKFTFRNLDDLSKTVKTIILPTNDQYFSCLYSPDGSYIVARNSNNICVLAPNKQEDYFFINALELEDFQEVTFHPDGTTLAILNIRRRVEDYPETFISYWNLITKECVDTMKVDVGCGKDFSFSKNGLQVVTAFATRLIRTTVPWAMKKECIKLFFLLNMIKEEKKLPQGVIRHCIDAFCRSLSFKF